MIQKPAASSAQIPTPLDLYSYASGDPVNYRDPSGRFRSPEYGTIGSTSLDILGNPYLHGGLRMHGGYTQAMIGAGIITAGIATGALALLSHVLLEAL